MGLDIYLYESKEHAADENSFASTQDANSRVHPDHLCRRRYLRSSYNGGGFNHVTLNALGVDGFYYIFEPMLAAIPDEHEYFPTKEQLTEAKSRALEVAAKLKDAPKYRVLHEGMNVLRTESEYDGLDERRAMEIFLAEVERQKAKPKNSMLGDSYSTKDGAFFFDEEPLKVRALIPGMGPLQDPCVHVVYEYDGMEHYVQSAEIAAEFCDEALAMETPCIHWSA